jgi:hypothetical protein
MADYLIRKNVRNFYYYIQAYQENGKTYYYWTGLRSNAQVFSEESKGWVLKDVQEQNKDNGIIDAIRK